MIITPVVPRSVPAKPGPAPVPVTLTINGQTRSLAVQPWTTLLDLLRTDLALTGTKKGCDHGQCGACTVHVDGERKNACLLLAVMQDGREITTIEGLAEDGALHALQRAFVTHDAYQCGYCTPGQIMSGVALIKEGRAATREDIREQMSGNLCRCGAYPNIVDAVEAVLHGTNAAPTLPDMPMTQGGSMLDAEPLRGDRS